MLAYIRPSWCPPRGRCVDPLKDQPSAVGVHGCPGTLTVQPDLNPFISPNLWKEVEEQISSLPAPVISAFHGIRRNL
jgi:hypothetical protein